LSEVGGKAHNLGRLLAAGLDVPSGFVVLSRAREADRATLVRAIEPYIHAHLGRLWAVRSSAADEDSEALSFAGQYVTFLNVEAEHLLERIQDCWQSVNSQAARAYRQGHIAPRRLPALAVIAQAMVQAEVSGVAFSADPISGALDTLVIEMTRGLGAQLVGGNIAPLRIKLDRATGRFREGDPIDTLPLTPEAIKHLVGLILKVESAMGGPQDIEWAYAGGRFWLLQARPITTDQTQWTRANIGEVMPGVVTPLTWSVFRAHVTGKSEGDDHVIRLIGGRAYLRRESVLESFEWLIWADRAAVSRALGLEPRAASRPASRRGVMALGASLLFVLEAIGATRRLAHRVEQFCHAQSPPRGETRDLNVPDLFEQLAAWDAWTRRAFRLHLYTTTYAVGAYGFLMRLLPSQLDEETQAELLRQLTASRSADLSRALWNLATQARRAGLTDVLFGNQIESIEAALASHPAEREWLDGFQSFLNEYGDRAAEEFELRAPRWREQPTFVLALIQRYLRQPDTRQIEPPSAEMPTPGGPLARWLFGRLRVGYARFVALREAMKHEVIRGYSALRELYLEFGHRLTERGALETSDDIFFLTADEVKTLIAGDATSVTERVRFRRAQWERYQHRATVPEFSTQAATCTLRGIGCSQGIVEGRARVVFDLSSGLTVEPGEVLVVPHADPGWTPLFLCASAVVADVGGFLSHSATVAREFDIPAVFNVKDATRLLQTGQRVRVDGARGLVEVLA
jgi:pyruvate,water dikinase